MPIIEFVGVPGAGKSTVSQVVAEQLGFHWRSLNVDGADRRLQRMVGIASNPQLAWALATKVRSGPGLSVMLHLLPRVRVQSQLVGDVVVDSGATFMAGAAVSSLQVSPGSLLRFLPIPDMLILLHLSPKLASERVRSRGRVNRGDDFDWEAAADRTARLSRGLESLFMAAPCWKVKIEVGPDMQPSVVAESTLAAIREGLATLPLDSGCN